MNRRGGQMNKCVRPAVRHRFVPSHPVQDLKTTVQTIETRQRFIDCDALNRIAAIRR